MYVLGVLLLQEFKLVVDVRVLDGAAGPVVMRVVYRPFEDEFGLAVRAGLLVQALRHVVVEFLHR